jgi:GH24 family phage-related lysozyme (muramidase)
MRIKKNFLLEKLGVTSAVTAMSMATSQATNNSSKPTYADAEIKKMVLQDEGIRTDKYLDTRGIPTVGIGHNLGEEKASLEAFKRAFGSEGEALRNAVMSGSRLTKQQAEKLFEVDYEEHRNRAVKMIPDLDKYDPEVQSMLVSGTYRGHVSDSPRFRKLLAAGKYEEAATELLNRDEYKNPKKVI